MRARTTEEHEGGFTLVELVVAISLIAIVATGFLASISIGFRTVAVARQRTTASELATKTLEHIRNVPFEQIALNKNLLSPGEPALAHNLDDTHPNYYVDDTNPAQPTYDYTGSGDIEPIVVDDTNGAIDYVEDPVKVGATSMDIYVYATWVDDPATTATTEDYKRVTVVIRYKAPAVNGVNVLLRMSSLFSKGTVTITPPSSTPTTTTPTTTPGTTTPPTTNPSACPGDTAGPSGSFTIGATADAETGFTAVQNVSLQVSLTDTCEPMYVSFSNDNTNWGSEIEYDPSNPTVSWTLTSGNGTKIVYGQARDNAGNVTALAPQSVVLDATAPSAPGNVIYSVSCSKTNRTVSLSWVASSDAEGNLRGYRVYRSTDGATFPLSSTVFTTTYSDTTKKNLDSVRYYVVAYDKAGNLSAKAPTTPLSFGKNQCS